MTRPGQRDHSPTIVNRMRLPSEIECRALNLVATFRAELRVLIGAPKLEFVSFEVLQSVNGPTIDLDRDTAIVLVGPNATAYEPTLFANLAHESVHLHFTDGACGNASGLEEGFALYFALSAVKKHFGPQERQHQVDDLPRTYATALSDYEDLLQLTDNPAMRVLAVHGRLTGVTARKLRRLFPTVGWWASYRLSRRRRMRRPYTERRLARVLESIINPRPPRRPSLFD
jgi:hypothetical protein